MQYPSPFVFPGIVRAARAALGWSQGELGEASGIGPRTIASIETGRKIPRHSTLQKLDETFSNAGLVFIANDTGIAVLADYNVLNAAPRSQGSLRASRAVKQ